MTNSRSFAYIQDPGHGWIEVPRSLLDELNIADKISSFSYIKGRTAYLEEDMDAGTFMDAFGKANPSTVIKLTERHTNSDSQIRRYAPYPGSRNPLRGAA